VRRIPPPAPVRKGIVGREFEMNLARFFLLLAVAVLLSSCVLTKVVTVPMRVGGAVISIIPVAGNTAHRGIDEAADTIDDIPI